ncbi:MAG: glyoxalase superfamily protein, partial [Pyrinomonadaceae bacterium]
MQKVYPTLRITDYEKSKSFYVDGLGFQIDGSFRFAGSSLIDPPATVGGADKSLAGPLMQCSSIWGHFLFDGE